MTIETGAQVHRDVSEKHVQWDDQSANQLFGLDLTSRDFNSDFSTARQKYVAADTPTSVAPKDASTQQPTEKGTATDRAAIRPETAAALKGIEFKNVDASDHFAKHTREAFDTAFNRLTPELQHKLAGLKVETGSRIDKMIAGSKDEPARTTEPGQHLGRMMAFSEKGINSDKVPVQDVMNHEIWHAIEDVTKGSKDPELRKAIDLGISRLSKTEQSHIAAPSLQEKVNRYSELGGDILAMETGSKQSNLSYVTHLTKPYDTFKEAREIIRQKYLRHDDK